MYACRTPLSTSFPPDLGGVRVCVCVCGWVDVQARVSVCEWVSECVCLLYPSIFIFYSRFCFGSWSFSGFSLFPVLEMRTILFSFLLPFVSFCCMHLYFIFTAVSYQMFFHWCSFMYPHWGFWNKPLDLTCQERLENCLLRGQLSVLTLVSVSVPSGSIQNMRKLSE